MVTSSVEPPHAPPIATPPLHERRVAQLTAHMARWLRDECCIKEPFASFIASGLVEEQRRRAGDAWLWQVGVSKEERNAAIRAEFNGTNLKDVCRKHQVSPATVYRVTRERPAAAHISSAST